MRCYTAGVTRRTALAIGALLSSAALQLAACNGEKTDATPGPTATARPVRARLTALSGDVKVKLLEGTDYEAATKDMGLGIGDLVTTGDNGNATLTFNDGSTAVITPRSLVTIEPPATSAADGIGVQRGRVDVEITSGGAGFEVGGPEGVRASPK